MKRLYLIVLFIPLLAGFVTIRAQAQLSTPTPTAVPDIGSNSLTNSSQPANLSQSGAASQPRLLAGPDGKLQSFWWDRFDGITTATFDGQKWSAPQPAPIASKFLVNTPLLIADQTGWIHAFWLEPAAASTSGRANETPLMHSQVQFSSNLWTPPELLAQSALAYDVKLDGEGKLLLAYLRPLHSSDAPAGVYVRQNPGSGGPWGTSIPVFTSIYYRLLTPDNAYIRLSDANNGSAIYLAWEDPQQELALYSTSLDNGLTWQKPSGLGSQDEPIIHPRIINLPNEEGVLLLWEKSELGNCTLYQRLANNQKSGAALNFAAPSLAIKGLNTCPKDDQFWQNKNRILWSWGAGSSDLMLAAWDPASNQWSLPVGLDFSFKDPESTARVNLDNLHSVFSQGQLDVIGSDDRTNEVWSTIVNGNAIDLASKPLSGWSKPAEITNSQLAMHSPVVIGDSNGGEHAFWIQEEQKSTTGRQTSIYYSGWDGKHWSHPLSIFQGARGSIDALAVTLLANKRLLLAWSSGDPSSLYYSWANAGQANSAREWADAKPFPIPQPGCESPAISSDSGGKIYAICVVPVNEARGLYLTQSTDQGETWSDAIQIFDGKAAQWDIVGPPHLAITDDGALHIIWSRFALPLGSDAVGVYYSHSEDGGLNWSESQPMVEAPASKTWLLAPHGQTLYRGWFEENAGLLLFKHEASNDGGQTWSSPASISIAGATADQISVTGDPAGQLHLLWLATDGNGNLSIQHLRWDGESWAREESADLGYDPALVPQALAAAISNGGQLAAAYLTQTQDQQNVLLKSAISSTSRTLNFAPGSTILLQPTVSISEPTFTPTPVFTPAPTPTPDLAEVIQKDQLQTQGPSQGNNWGGLILGSILAVGIVGALFSYRLLALRKR